MLWFVVNISVLGLSWGAWIPGLELSFWQMVVARNVGIIVSFLLCDVVAALGKRSSAPALALSRTTSGYNGNCLSMALSWILTVDWGIVLCASATLALATVFQALGQYSQVGTQTLGFLFTVGLAASAGILGFEAIMEVQVWIVQTTDVLTTIYLVLVAPQISIHKIPALPLGGPAAFIGTLVMVATGFGLNWVNAAADYSRHLPRKASTAGVIGWIALGSALPCVALVFFGILLVGSDAELGQTINTDPAGTLTTIPPTWLPIPFAIVVILGLAGGIIMDLYSSSLSLPAIGLPMHRYVVISIDVTIMIVGTIAVTLGADDFLSPFRGFLTTLGIAIAAWVGVMVTEVILCRHDYDEKASLIPNNVYGSVNWKVITLMAAGPVVGWGLVINSATSRLPRQGHLLGPFGGHDGAWTGANFSVPIALLIGVFGHLALGWGRVTSQKARS